MLARIYHHLSPKARSARIWQDITLVIGNTQANG